MKIFSNNLLLTLLQGMLFCAAAFMVNEASAGEPVTYDQNKTAVTITAAQPVFKIKLAANPTTGYTWILRDYDKDLVLPVKHEFQSPTSGLIGAGGFDTWTFKMKAQAFTVPQRTSLKMEYVRPWEEDKPGTQVIFVITTG